MISLFEKNLKRMKSELTELKTAHKRGLGTIEFFRYRVTVTTTGPSYFTVRGTIATGEPGYPLVIGLARGSDNSADVIVIDSSSSSTTAQASFRARSATTATVDLICSSVLTGVAKI